jgi:anti-sigma factor RsiW
MSIDRHNYEEFFILYMDNELSSEQRRAVELFAQANPDLQEELAMLLQSRFVADEAIAFDDKASLMRFADCDITLDNYEEWLLLYIDNELAPQQRTIVENFANTNPAVKQEFELFKQTKLQREEAVIFPHKESLYRKEETSRRVVAMRWWRIAAAAVLILAVGTVSLLVFDNNDGPVVTGPIAGTPSNPSTPKSNQLADQSTPQSKKDEQVIDRVKDEVAVKPATIKNSDRKTIKAAQPVEKQDEPVFVAVNNSGNKNNLPETTYNRNIQGTIEQNGKAGLIAVRSKELTDINESDVILAVTHNTPSTLEHAVEIEEEAQPDRKNNKFRGFLRKVTRTVEKTTNLKTTDDDGRLLIAGLAIKL